MDICVIIGGIFRFLHCAEYLLFIRVLQFYVYPEFFLFSFSGNGVFSSRYHQLAKKSVMSGPKQPKFAIIPIGNANSNPLKTNSFCARLEENMRGVISRQTQNTSPLEIR